MTYLVLLVCFFQHQRHFMDELQVYGQNCNNQEKILFAAPRDQTCHLCGESDIDDLPGLQR